MTKIEKSPVSGSIELEDKDVLILTGPGIELVGEKMSRKLPFDFDVEQPNSQRRGGKTCPCDNKVASQGYVSFVSSSKDVGEWSINPAEDKVSDSLGVSFFNVPLKLRSSGLFSGSLKSQRRTKSVSDLSDFVLGYSAGSSSGNVIVNPPGRWLFGSIEGNLMAKALIKSSLIFQLDTLDRALGGVGSRPVNVRQINSSELTWYPSGFSDTCLQKPMYKDSHFRKQSSRSSVSEKLILTSTSTSSPSSFVSNSSAQCPVYKGTIHCVWKKGIRCFMFSVDNDCGQVYVADPQKIEPSADQATDCMYLFYSNIDGGKDARNKDNCALDFVGKMKVSSSLVLDSNISRFMETEFVLYGAYDDHHREMKSSIPAITKCKGLSKKVTKLFRSNHSFKHKSIHKVGGPSFGLEDSLSGSFSGQLNDIDKPASMNHSASDLPSNLELAAVVVKNYRQYENKEVITGGWGLKFLKDIEVDHADTEPSFASKVSKGSCMRRNFGRHMTVILPAGFHGGPVSRNGGPSSLTERWTGGRCDCGGWDIGCPLRVLENSTHSEALAQDDSFEDCNSVSFFVEWSKNQDLMFSLFPRPLIKWARVHEVWDCVSDEPTKAPGPLVSSFDVTLQFIWRVTIQPIQREFTKLNMLFTMNRANRCSGSYQSANLLSNVLTFKGASHDEPMMRMIHIKEGMYYVYFNSSLSALQSFSIGVAIVHTESPDH